MIKLFNTLTRKKEIFKPIKKGKASMYCCGLTVYNYAHIGNLRTYIFEDILRRTLEYNNFKIKHIMNITDVGHLTSDADQGEDKMEKGAKREGKTAYQIAQFYTKEFKKDLKKLNILPPHLFPKATDHIKEQIDWIKKLEKSNFTYQTSDGIYFNTTKFKAYGKLANLKKQKLKPGKRVSLGQKKNKTDFALWKFSSKKQKRQMEWSSPWGTGFPGWHIECSVMATKYLGKKIDIHCGGIDHIPIHHPNEIAQTEAITKKQWVNYWLHGEFLLENKEKMAKSKGYFLTLKKLEQKHPALTYRYFCLNTHYRKQLNFTFKALESAKISLEKLQNKIIELKTKDSIKPNKNLENKLLNQFKKSINDDLNTPEVLAVLWTTLKSKLSNKQKLKIALEIDQILGLNLKSLKTIKIPQEIKALADKRLKARLKKDWTTSDKIRTQIAKKGYSIDDTQDSYILNKK
jgi:cysteinyl-tRNA synthetase